jgi:hypothetical protein
MQEPKKRVLFQSPSGNIQRCAHHVSNHFVQGALQVKINAIPSVSLIHQVDFLHSSHCPKLSALALFLLFHGTRKGSKVVRSFESLERPLKRQDMHATPIHVMSSVPLEWIHRCRCANAIGIEFLVAIVNDMPWKCGNGCCCCIIGTLLLGNWGRSLLQVPNPHIPWKHAVERCL